MTRKNLIIWLGNGQLEKDETAPIELPYGRGHWPTIQIHKFVRFAHTKWDFHYNSTSRSLEHTALADCHTILVIFNHLYTEYVTTYPSMAHHPEMAWEEMPVLIFLEKSFQPLLRFFFLTICQEWLHCTKSFTRLQLERIKWFFHVLEN